MQEDVGGRAFQAEQVASAKVLSQEHQTGFEEPPGQLECRQQKKQWLEMRKQAGLDGLGPASKGNP